jgi:hypothetical protein
MVAFAVTSAASGTNVIRGAAEASGTDRVRAQEWWLAGLGVPRAWHDSYGAGVTVAVLSTGVSTRAADLSGNVVTGPDYSASGRTEGGPYWGVVGTAVAGIIAGHGHGSGHDSGVEGIAPAAKILSVRVTLEYNDPLNASSAITRQLTGAIASGIMYAVSHGAKVIDLPLDPGTFGLAGDGAAAGGSAAEQSAVRYALSKDVVLIAPGGDNGMSTAATDYPAAYPGVIAVGATSRGGQVAGFSNQRSHVSVNAPGVGLLATAMLPDGVSGYAPGYSQISTTSVASAMVAGVAALVESKYPALTPAQVTSALRASATGKTSVVNAGAAMKAASTLAASVKPAVSPPPVKTRESVPAPAIKHRATPPRAASAVASSVLRDAVYALGALILLMLGGVLLTMAWRKRTNAAMTATAAGQSPAPAGAAAVHTRVRGSHEQRKPGSDRVGPDDEVLAGLRRMAKPGSATASGWPASAGSRDGGDWVSTDWQSGSGWQGSSLGEVAHSSTGQSAFGQPAPGQPALGQPPSLDPRPVLAPLPKTAAKADQGPGSPPWAPAPEPDQQGVPLPLLGSGSFPEDPGGAFRVPGDIPEPFTGRDVLTQANFGFAAAPVPADFATQDEPAGESTESFPVVPGFDQQEPE